MFKSDVKRKQTNNHFLKKRSFHHYAKNWLYQNNLVDHDADTLLIHLFGRRVRGLGNAEASSGGTTQVRPVL